MKSKLTRQFGVPLAAALYVCAALLVDTLASQHVQIPIDWAMFVWRDSNHFDFFKFTIWLLAPLLVCVPKMDWCWYGLGRWTRVDWWILVAGLVVGAAAIAVVSWEPNLQRKYAGIGSSSAQQKWIFAKNQLVWTLSWIFGWEFLHRYVLPRGLMAHSPKRGWWIAIVLIPCFEGIYHLQKPLLEAGGMVLFSLASTWWVLRRRNALLPLVVHLAIECQLIVTRIVT